MKNNNLGTFFFIIVLIAILFFIYKKFYDKTSPFKSNIYNKDYKVRDNGSPEVREIKANLLGNVYNRLETLVNTLKSGENISPEYQTAVNRLISNWDKGVTIKETGIMENDAAFVINKQYMSICLVNFCDTKKCGNINSEANLNLLAYVGIHELAHIMSLETEHGAEFRNNFKFLLDYSKDINYYDLILKRNIKLYIDLKSLQTPDNFCGVSVVNSMS